MSVAHQLSFQILESANRCRSVDAFLPILTAHVAHVLSTPDAPVDATLTIATGGVWSVIARSSDAADSPPRELLAETADRVTCQRIVGWVGVPLVFSDTARTAVLALHGVLHDEMELEDIMKCVTSALQLIESRDRERRQCDRLSKISQISSRWHGSLDLEPLLEEMAQASTDLLGAERATIFLWDRKTKTLVGRPALGVEVGELRVPEAAGVVGQVVRTTQSQRVSENEAGSAISREVEKQVQFVTRNLVCVPLISRKGKTLGAFEVLNKRIGDFDQRDEKELGELALHAAAAIDACHNFQQLLAGRKERSSADEPSFIGSSPEIDQLQAAIRRIGPSDLSVLILGENGTGKEVASRMIYRLSGRRGKPFLAVNCAAMSETLLDSELFGHEKGAFTDAHESRQGKFELAAEGTLFLDEIGELPLSSQAKLLRVLEEKSIVRVGGTQSIPTDVRVLAATNRDLGGMVRSGTFREDLFFRLNVITIEMPTLRARGNDILQLAEHFLAEFSLAAHRRTPEFSPAAAKQLRSHPWPGNVRELRNLMERLAYLTSGETIQPDDLHLSWSSDSAEADDLPLTEATRDFQIAYIQQQIRKAGGNVTDAAKRLGMHRSNLYRKMGQLGMSDSD